MIRTLIMGKAYKKHRNMHAIACEVLEACEAAIIPRKPMRDVFAAQAKVFDKAGLNHARLDAYSYATGATFNLIWVNFPIFYENYPRLISKRQVFFFHMILIDNNTGLAMYLDHSAEVSAQRTKRLSRHSLELFELWNQKLLKILFL